MSLIVCADCGQSVSDRAASCPSCGRPSDRKGQRRNLLLVVAICFGFIGAIAGFTAGNLFAGCLGVFAIMVASFRLLLSG